MEMMLNTMMIKLAILGVLAVVMYGCKSNDVVPIADQQSKTPPANTAAGQAVKRFREKRQGNSMGPDAGIKSGG